MKTQFWIRERTTQFSIQMRIIIGNEKQNISTGLMVDKIHWIDSDLLCNPISKDLIEKNKKLTLLRSKIEKIYNDFTFDGIEPNVRMVIDKYKNPIKTAPLTANHVPTIKHTFDLIMLTKKAQLNERIGKATYKRYHRFIEHFQTFLTKEKIKQTEAVTKVDNILVTKFFGYLLNDKGYAVGYVNKFRDFLYMFVDVCERQYNGSWRLNFNMKDFRTIPEPPKELVRLELFEVEIIKNAHLVGTLAKARDIFMLLIETGLHVADYRKFIYTGQPIKDIYNQDWIRIYRQKTMVKIDIFLTPTIKDLIQKYGSIEKLPTMSDQKLNDHLKLLAIRCNIDKHLTTKVGRKSFAHKLLNHYLLSIEVTGNRMGIENGTVYNYGRIENHNLLSEEEKKMYRFESN